MGLSFPSKNNILIFNIHIKTNGHQCSRQDLLTGDIFATGVGKKQEEESAEIRELLCQPTNANGMTNTKRSHKKNRNKSSDQKVYVFNLINNASTLFKFLQNNTV